MALIGLAAALAPTVAQAQPRIEVAPPDAAGTPAGAPAAAPTPGAPPAAPATASGPAEPTGGPAAAIPRPAALNLARESAVEVSLSTSNVGTGIGAYGEILLTGPVDHPGDPVVVDVRRLVLFVGHNFTEHLRVYTEFEVEHAVASSTDQGEFEIEQAFLDYLLKRPVNFRAGLILMPVGIVNQYHEPPTFNGALRPETDTRIIPSTWREVGAGLFGGVGPMRYQAYGVTSFVARKFSADGIAEAHQEGQLALGHDWGAVGRIDVAPLVGLDLGVSGYYASASQGDPAVSAAGVGLVEADARFRWRGIEARAEFVNLWIDKTFRINQARLMDAAAMTPPQTVDPVSHQLRGGYVEAGYNLLQPFRLRYSPSLVLFARFERTNTQADVIAFKAAPLKDRQLITVGLNYRPIAEVAVKLDYQRITAFGDDSTPTDAWNQINVGLAFMF